MVETETKRGALRLATYETNIGDMLLQESRYERDSRPAAFMLCADRLLGLRLFERVAATNEHLLRILSEPGLLSPLFGVNIMLERRRVSSVLLSAHGCYCHAIDILLDGLFLFFFLELILSMSFFFISCKKLVNVFRWEWFFFHKVYFYGTEGIRVTHFSLFEYDIITLLRYEFISALNKKTKFTIILINIVKPSID